MPRGGDAELVPGRPVNPAPLQERLELELRRKIRDQIGDDASDIVVRPYFGEPAPCIVEIAGEVKAQLVAVGTHQRSVLGRLAHASVSRELLHQAAMNVVCVPVTAQFDPREAHIPVIKRVLVATDFSAVGNAAVPFACTVCGSGGLVKIIHVTAPKKAKLRRGGDGGADDLAAQLQALVPNEARERWLPPEVEVIADADVALAICREAERFAADVVCVASHGVGLSRAFHGSVTKAVLKQIRRPLLVFRRAEE
jgi:nucleotide-binding universal stress UspA family protein